MNQSIKKFSTSIKNNFRKNLINFFNILTKEEVTHSLI